eukprot:Nk52_evm50s212 gene=Nk52_evmTU50s212
MDDSDSESQLTIENTADNVSSPGGDSSEEDSLDGDEKRREALEKMAEIEKEFAELKETLYHEKMAQLTKEIDEIGRGEHPGVHEDIKELKNAREERLRQAELYRQYQIANINHFFESEKQEVDREYDEKRKTIQDQKLQDLIEKRSKLEEEKDTLDLSGDIGTEARGAVTRKLRRRNDGVSDAKRKKIPAVSAPHIVYNLKEEEILEDLYAIKKTVSVGTKRRLPVSRDTEDKQSVDPPAKMAKTSSTAGKSSGNAETAKPARAPVKENTQVPSPSTTSSKARAAPDPKTYSAYYDKEKLHYEQQIYGRGDQIYIENKHAGRYTGVITALNTGEVWVRRTDGSKTKLYISQLRLGKYCIKPMPELL